MKNSQNAACRVALAGLVHDMRRFAKRAGAEDTVLDVLVKAAPDGEEDFLYQALNVGRQPAS